MPEITRDRCITPSFSPSTYHRRKLMDGEGLSQISGVDGSSGMVVDFVASGSGGRHDPEGDCREAAGIQASGKGPSSYTAQLPTPTGQSVQHLWLGPSPDHLCVKRHTPSQSAGGGSVRN